MRKLFTKMRESKVENVHFVLDVFQGVSFKKSVWPVDNPFFTGNAL